MAQGTAKSAAERIAKKYGAHSFEKFKKKELISISTGSLLLNQSLGKFKGYPEGAFIEAYGWEGSGKTLMLYLAIAEAQRKFPDRPCAILDAEKQFKYQADWAETIGVNVEELYVKEISSAEEAFDILEMLILGEVKIDSQDGSKTVIKAGNFSIIGIDSISQLVPLDEVNKDMEVNTKRGAQATAIGRGMRTLTSAMVQAKSQTTIFMINQLRMNPNAGMFSNPEYRPGGNSLKFYDTLAFEVKKVPKSEIVGSDGKIISHRAKIKITKSKIAAKPKDWIEFKLNYDGTGIDVDTELLDVAKLNKLLINKGRTYGIAATPGDEDSEFSDKFPTFKSSEKNLDVDFKEYLSSNKKVKELILDYVKEGKFYVVEEKKVVGKKGKISKEIDLGEDPEEDEEE